MNIVFKLTSLLGLALTVVPAFLVFTGTFSWGTHAVLMAVGTVLWFTTAPLWMHGETRRTSLWKRRRPL